MTFSSFEPNYEVVIVALCSSPSAGVYLKVVDLLENAGLKF
uniref:Uncharacterized protein n=1 Tax=Arundo donax TaxID=35708 RepID=A0A0A9C237_ARUDO